MKRLFALTLVVLLLITGCSPREIEEESELDLEKITDDLYIQYDRTKFENVAPHKPYYAEIAVYGEDEMSPFFSATPKVYEDGNYLEFENGDESGHTHRRGGMFFGRKYWTNYCRVYAYRPEEKESSVENLDFMPLAELYERFESEAHRFIPDVEIYEVCSLTTEDFAKVAAEEEPPVPEIGWSEPKDFYYIYARQFIDGIPLFTTVMSFSEDSWLNGADIEAIYSEDGVEHFDITGSTYKVIGEAPVNGSFIDYAGAEQIIRDMYEMPYGYDYVILSNAELVYVPVFDENNKIVLTPMWEFYYMYNEPTASKECDMVWIRLDAYTGELMWI